MDILNNIKNIVFLVRLLWRHNKRYFVVIAISFLLPCVINLVQVIFPKEVLLSLEEEEFLKSYIIAVTMCIIVFFMNAISLLVGYKKYSYSGAFEITLNKLLAKATAAWPYQKFESYAFREKYQFASRCVKQGTIDIVIGCVASVMGSVLSFISLLFIFYVVVWWLWIIIVLSVFVNIICEIYRAKYDYHSYKKYSTIDMRMRYARDTLSWKEFAKETRLFHMYDYVTETANHYISMLSNLQKQRAWKTLAAYLISCVFDFIQRIAVFAYIAYQCYIGAISIADFSMLVLAIITISALVINIAKDFVRIGEAAKYIGAYVDIIRNKDAKKKKEILVERKDKDFRLVFQNVSFAYPGSKDMALENISFIFESKKKYGLVGANGSGKTTFVNLLMGMYTPTSGTILYNDKSVSDFTEESWREMFSAVLQDFNIYAYTVAENVSMFSDKGKSIQDALECAGIEKIDEEEYLTAEYMQGREISGGEAQKLAIARTFYRDATIFVLDEPTAALSPVNEYELYNNISKDMKDKMLFFISHRLASCQMCDEILVFDKGRIVEAGSHAELLKRDGVYAKMFQAQAYLYDEGQVGI